MKEYLIKCKIIKKGFFSNKEYEDSDIIQAKNAEEARQKWKKKWATEILIINLEPDLLYSITEIKQI